MIIRAYHRGIELARQIKGSPVDWERNLLDKVRRLLVQGKLSAANFQYNCALSYCAYHNGLSRAAIEPLVLYENYLTLDLQKAARLLAGGLRRLAQGKGRPITVRLDGSPASGKTLFATALNFHLDQLGIDAALLQLDSCAIIGRHKQHLKTPVGFDGRTTLFNQEHLKGKVDHTLGAKVLIVEGYSILQDQYDSLVTPPWDLNIVIAHSPKHQKTLRWRRDVFFHGSSFAEIHREWKTISQERPSFEQLIGQKANVVVNEEAIVVSSSALKQTLFPQGTPTCQTTLAADPLIRHLKKGDRGSLIQAYRIAQNRYYEYFAKMIIKEALRQETLPIL